MFSKCQFLVRDGVLIFWGIPHGVPIASEYSQELCWKMNDVGLSEHLPHFLSSEIWPPNFELPFHQEHCSCQNLFLPSCQKNWFCSKVRPDEKNWFSSKVRPDDLYLLLRSIASNWIHIVVRRISQACCLHHLKKTVKRNFGMKNKMRRFFGPSVYIICNFNML